MDGQNKGFISKPHRFDQVSQNKSLHEKHHEEIEVPLVKRPSPDKMVDFKFLTAPPPHLSGL